MARPRINDRIFSANEDYAIRLQGFYSNSDRLQLDGEWLTIHFQSSIELVSGRILFKMQVVCCDCVCLEVSFYSTNVVIVISKARHAQLLLGLFCLASSFSRMYKANFDPSGPT